MWKGKCMMYHGVANRAQNTSILTTSVARNSNVSDWTHSHEYTGTCNTPLSNLNWMIAGHFLINDYIKLNKMIHKLKQR